MPKQTESDPISGPEAGTDGAAPFRRMFVAIDDSKAGKAAVDLVAEWVGGPGAGVCFVQVSEERRQRHSGVESESAPTDAEQADRLVVRAPTRGARNRRLARDIAEAAEDFGADVIVLGIDRRRLAGHRLAPSVRQQIMRVTDLPVLVGPSSPSGGVPHYDQERAPSERRYAHV
jgi:nucleotide-binding universal stress UspA family protein